MNNLFDKYYVIEVSHPLKKDIIEVCANRRVIARKLAHDIFIRRYGIIPEKVVIKGEYENESRSKEFERKQWICRDNDA